ncbi:MAG: hypothetical protein E7226_04480 [Clostridiales bacterium]|nr:hypothetical protein [Clostridiales bacterium]
MTELKLVFRNRKGVYTVEAAICLPLVMLVVITLGYFIEADSAWENSMNAAFRECSYAQSSGLDLSKAAIGLKLRRDADGFGQDVNLNLSGRRYSYSDGRHTDLNTFRLRAEVDLALPLRFGRSFDYDAVVKYRDFVGLRYDRPALGADGLEQDEDSAAVWIFPQSGTKYHDENCTYVKATVHSCILTNALKRQYEPCAMCGSGSLPSGSMVFCFYGDDTCYHRGSCRSIKRHTVVVDRGEAEEKGYTPCSKCGG